MFIFSADNFRQMYRRLRYTQEYVKYQRVQGHIIAAKEQAVREKRNILSGERTTQHHLLSQGKAQQTILEGQQRNQQVVVTDLNKKQAELHATLAQQQRQFNALNAKIDQLIRAEKKHVARQKPKRARKRRRQHEKQLKSVVGQPRRHARQKRKHEEPRQKRATKLQKRNVRPKKRAVVEKSVRQERLAQPKHVKKLVLRHRPRLLQLKRNAHVQLRKKPIVPLPLPSKMQLRPAMPDFQAVLHPIKVACPCPSLATTPFQAISGLTM